MAVHVPLDGLCGNEVRLLRERTVGHEEDAVDDRAHPFVYGIGKLCHPRGGIRAVVGIFHLRLQCHVESTARSFQLQRVARDNVRGLLLVLCPQARIGVTSGQEAHRRLPRLYVLTVVVHRDLALVGETALAVVDGVHQSCRGVVRRHGEVVLAAPLPRCAGRGGIVGVVAVEIGHRARVVGEAQTEQLGTVATVGAHAHIGIHRPAKRIDALQPHVHHQLLLAVVQSLYAQGYIAVRFAPIDLHLVNHVGWQVVERNLGIATEEVPAVDEQVIHELAVHVDSPAFQFDARQLTHQRIEHRAVSQFKGIGVIDNGVATHHHLDLGGGHHHFAQVSALYIIIGCSLLRFLSQLHRVEGDTRAAMAAEIQFGAPRLGRISLV